MRARGRCVWPRDDAVKEVQPVAGAGPAGGKEAWWWRGLRSIPRSNSFLSQPPRSTAQSNTQCFSEPAIWLPSRKVSPLPTTEAAAPWWAEEGLQVSVVLNPGLCRPLHSMTARPAARGSLQQPRREQWTALSLEAKINEKRKRCAQGRWMTETKWTEKEEVKIDKKSIGSEICERKWHSPSKRGKTWEYHPQRRALPFWKVSVWFPLPSTGR